METLRIPIVVMSFNRPHFLSQTLETLRSQDGFAPDRYDIHLFQDGSVNRWSRMQYAEQGDIDACIKLFREYFPAGQVHYAGDNIGICESFWQAENFVFNELKAESAWFFEDDMVLSPAYFRMMLKLDDFAKRTPRISYFSVYGNYYASSEEVAENLTSIIPLDHHWAFGLRRQAWMRMQPALEGYYALVRGRDYSRRNHRAIFEYFAGSGLVPRGSSQDAAKTWVCARLELVRIRTFAPYARYIGTQGAHMTPEKFEELGYSRTTMLQNVIDDLKFPDGSALANTADDQRRALYDIFRNEYDEIRASLPSVKHNPMRPSTFDDVMSAYILLLQRVPKSETIVFEHLGRTPVHSLVRGILASAEFQGIIDETSPSEYLDPKRMITKEQIVKLYALLLHREPDMSAQVDQRAGQTEVLSNVRNLTSSEEFRKIDRVVVI